MPTQQTLPLIEENDTSLLMQLYLEASTLQEILAAHDSSVPLYDLDALLHSNSIRRLKRVAFAYRSYLHFYLTVHDHDLLVSQGYGKAYEELVLSEGDPSRVISFEDFFWSPLINGNFDIALERNAQVSILKQLVSKETGTTIACEDTTCAFCVPFGIEDDI
jgi:hypothetical protein